MQVSNMSRSRATTLSNEKLLQQVNRRYEKVLPDNLDSSRRERRSTSSTRSRNNSQSRDKTTTRQNLNHDQSILKESVLMASKCIEQDQKLLKQGHKNPAVLAYLQRKLNQVIKKENMGVSTGIADDVLLFTSNLFRKKDPNLKNSFNGQSNCSVRRIPKIPEIIDLTESVEPQKKPSLNTSKVSNLKESCIKDSSVENSLYQSQILKHLKSGGSMLHSYCFKILLINLALMFLSFYLIGSNHPENNAKHIDNSNNSSYPVGLVNFTEEERLHNLNLEFQKMNQDLETLIDDISKPKPIHSGPWILSSFSLISFGLQVIFGIFYLAYKSFRND